MTFSAKNDAGLDIQRHYRSLSQPLCGLCPRWRWTRRWWMRSRQGGGRWTREPVETGPELYSDIDPLLLIATRRSLQLAEALEARGFPRKKEGLHSLNFDSSLWIIFYFMTSMFNSSRPLKSRFVIEKGTLGID